MNQEVEELKKVQYVDLSEQYLTEEMKEDIERGDYTKKNAEFIKDLKNPEMQFIYLNGGSGRGEYDYYDLVLSVTKPQNNVSQIKGIIPVPVLRELWNSEERKDVDRMSIVNRFIGSADRPYYNEDIAYQLSQKGLEQNNLDAPYALWDKQMLDEVINQMTKTEKIRFAIIQHILLHDDRFFFEDLPDFIKHGIQKSKEIYDLYEGTEDFIEEKSMFENNGKVIRIGKVRNIQDEQLQKELEEKFQKSFNRAIRKDNGETRHIDGNKTLQKEINSKRASKRKLQEDIYEDYNIIMEDEWNEAVNLWGLGITGQEMVETLDILNEMKKERLEDQR